MKKITKKIRTTFINNLVFIENNNLMDVNSKTDQGYGYSQALIMVFPDSFEEIAEIYQSWRMAIHPAYIPTFEDWKKKYTK